MDNGMRSDVPETNDENHTQSWTDREVAKEKETKKGKVKKH